MASAEDPKKEAAAETTEKTPLLSRQGSKTTHNLLNEGISDMQLAYGLEPHTVFQKGDHSHSDECLVDYQPLKLSTFRIFLAVRGTIITDPLLHIEQIVLILIFLCCAAPICYFAKDEVDGEVSVGRFIASQESKMRQFAGIMTSLSIFLLAFYTSIVVGRWWTMRTAGIGQIKAATVDLAMLLHQCVLSDAAAPLREKVLSAVQRYGRASMYLIFMWRRKQLNGMREMLVERELLSDNECDQLMKWNHCWHETIWAWQVAIVNKLHSQGKIKSDQLYQLLLEKCTDGRKAVQLCHTHVAVRVPMQYIHLLGFLVKMHNVVLAIIMGLIFGRAWQKGYVILCLQLFLRICILPLLFNAILLINCNLADPFDGSETDFPGEIYQQNLGKDCNGMIAALEHPPPWLDELELK